ncbi:MAG TPA: sulfate ABC transporter permease subunit CysW [Verrucomicrobiae bacterium]|nr:sulfate ABC transporter permease subunit CysW [Verrucomicrobiae bacterium]
MSQVLATRPLPKRNLSPRGLEEPRWVRWTLICLAVAFCAVFLLLPLANVFAQALSGGWRCLHDALLEPDTRAAIRLSFLTAGISVPLNLAFGLCAAWAITKFEFRGKTLLLTAIDLPFSVSPVVTGLMLVLLFGLQSCVGRWMDARGIQIIFAVPGMVLATIFVTFPYVARELIPAMRAAGVEQEQAALTLGASGWQIFLQVTLPSVKWGLLYGVILCNARALGEFGAVSVVSGQITGRTDTMPLRVEKLFNEYNAAGAFAVASLLALLALLTLALRAALEWKEAREHARGEAGIAE